MSNSSGKKFIRKIKFKANVSKSPKALAAKVIDNNSDILHKDYIDIDQIVDLLSLLFNEGGDDENTASNVANTSKTNNYNYNDNNTSSSNNNSIKSSSGKLNLESEILKIDLNKAPDAVVERAKEIMNVDFEKNRITPGSDEFEYDKRIEFQAATESNEWDEEEDD